MIQVLKDDELRDQMLARAALYNLFATALARRMDESWLNTDFQRILAAGLPDVEGKHSVLNALKEAGRNRKAFKAIQLEYDALFLVPGPKLIFPYESCYTRRNIDGTFGRLWQEPAQDMFRILQEWNIHFAEGWELIPDHIAVELFFMAELCRFAGEETLDAAELRTWQDKFLATHLLPWVFELLANLEKKADLAFYRGLAQLMRRFLEEERDELVTH